MAGVRAHRRSRGSIGSSSAGASVGTVATTVRLNYTAILPDRPMGVNAPPPGEAQANWKIRKATMLRFCANLELMFTEVPFVERFEAAAKSGFSAVEFPYPYAQDRDSLADLLHTHGLQQILINSPKGNVEAGERGFACLPGRQGEFQESIALSIEFASAFSSEVVHVMTGMTPEGVDDNLIHETYVENLRFAARRLAEHGIKTVIEPINTTDVPGYYLNRPGQALAVIRDAEEPNLFLDFDIYHAHVMGEDLAVSIEAAFAHIGHIQIADNPGRHEPGTGEIDYPSLFRLIDNLGYDGWIGCEYKPKMATVESLDWLRPYF